MIKWIIKPKNGHKLSKRLFAMDLPIFSNRWQQSDTSGGWSSFKALQRWIINKTSYMYRYFLLFFIEMKHFHHSRMQMFFFICCRTHCLPSSYVSKSQVALAIDFSIKCQSCSPLCIIVAVYTLSLRHLVFAEIEGCTWVSYEQMTIDFPSRPAGTNGSADADSGSARLFDAGLFGSTDVSLQSWFVLLKGEKNNKVATQAKEPWRPQFFCVDFRSLWPVWLRLFYLRFMFEWRIHTFSSWEAVSGGM